MAEPKKFDTVTIVGLALAAAVIYYGMNKSQEHERQRLEAIATENARSANAQFKSGTGGSPAIPNATGGVAGGKDEPIKAEKPAEDEKQNPETPDITVAGEFIELTFSSKGADIVSARLPQAYEDPAKKDKLGMLILTEIEPGKRAFGIPNFIFDATGASVELDGKKAASLDQRVWELFKDSGVFDASGNRTLVYLLTVKKLTLTKTFTINKSERFVKCSLAVENKTGQDGSLFYWLNGPQGIMPDIPPIDPKIGTSPQQMSIQTEIAGRDATESGKAANEPDVMQIYAAGTKNEDEKTRSISREENLWGAVKNRFHMATLISLEPRQLIKLLASKVVNENNPEDKRLAELNIGLVGYRSTIKLPNNATQLDPYALYLGPADDRHIEAAEAAMKTPTPYYMRQAIQFCDIFSWRWPRVDWLARQIMWVFQGLFKIFGSFGLSLLLTTILIKLALHPLQRRMMIHMSKMQKLQPDIEKIKAKYKGQSGLESQQRMQSEIRDLTAKHGASPVAGCLPMFIQIPVLSALYGIFSHAFDMRGANFLWIIDLSQPDHLAQLPFWPHWVNALPILYIILSYVQTRMAAAGQKKSDDPQQEMQKKMMMFMPVLIGVMWYTFMPAGLMLYFVISALWSALESWYIKNVVLHDPNAPMPQPTGI